MIEEICKFYRKTIKEFVNDKIKSNEKSRIYPSIPFLQYEDNHISMQLSTLRKAILKDSKMEEKSILDENLLYVLSSLLSIAFDNLNNPVEVLESYSLISNLYINSITIIKTSEKRNDVNMAFVSSYLQQKLERLVSSLPNDNTGINIITDKLVKKKKKKFILQLIFCW